MKALFHIILVLFLTNHTLAQSSNSPYTFFGEGKIKDPGFGVNHAMGGTGVAFKSTDHLNNINPASYSGLDSLTFILEIGAFLKHTKFSSNSSTEYDFNANLSEIALGFRINKLWVASIGIVPYSSVGYTIHSSSQVDGSFEEYSYTYRGDGGINKFYFGNSVEVIKNLSLGINASYLFGSITQEEILVPNDIVQDYQFSRKTYLNNLYLDYGIQYTIPFKGLNYTIGMTYGRNKELKTRAEYQLSYGYDSINLETDEETYIIPSQLGIGVSIEKSDRFRVGIDYVRNEWTGSKYSSELLKTRDSERYSFGAELSPTHSRMETGFRRLDYRIGGFYKKSYLIINNTPINSLALTAGVGIPNRRNLSIINLSIEAGKYATSKNNLIEENYWMVHLNFALRDRWFMKAKYD